MIEKRRDSKNRVLRDGESQRSDGRYTFKYRDAHGKDNYLYSWRLDVHDPYPAGKKKDKSLREKEADLQKDIFSGIFGAGRQVTVLSLAKKYCSLKIGVRESTKRGYKTVLNFLEKDSFGALNIGSIRRSDAKAWLVKLQKENGKSYSTIHTIRGVLRPAFQMAVDDELLTYNPFDFEMVSVIVNDSVRREAITRDEERRFLEFVKNDRHFSRYYEGIYILFNTGLRISEFCGLTRSDIDFKKHCFQVDKQLIRGADMVYMIEKPKTEAGTRTIPMSSEVESCFKRIIDNRRCKTKEVIVDGVGGFLYLDKNGMPMTALHWEHYFQHIVEKYNKIYRLQMPKVTPHVCRHTFCSKMAKSGMNPKALQYIMGHTDISVTLNTYTHLKFEDAEAEFKKVGNI